MCTECGVEMKKWLGHIFITLALIGGYSLVALAFFAAFVLCGYLLGVLVVDIAADPSLPKVLTAVALVGAITIGTFIVITRKKFKEGTRELWRQIFKNM